MLLEPLRRRRDKMFRELLEETNSAKEKKAINAMRDGNHLEFFQRFHGLRECPECHQPVGTDVGWRSQKHEALYGICAELKRLEEAELKTMMGA